MKAEDQLRYTKSRLKKEQYKRDRLALKLTEIEEEIEYLENKVENLKQWV